MTKSSPMSGSTHVTDDELVAGLDGEMSPADIVRVGDHIAACWTCRTRRDELATAMTDFVQARDTVLFPRIPPPASWQGLKPRLAQLDGRPISARELWARVCGLVGFRLFTLTKWRAAVAGATIFAIVIVAVQSLYERPLAAAQVLARARPVETLDGHRQLTIEERDAPSGRLLGRRRIDVWQNSARRVTARRLFDEQGRIVAGEWTLADGTRTVFVRGQSPHIEPSGVQMPVTPSNAWRLSPGAATFTKVTATSARALTPELSESDESYTVSAPLANTADATIALTVRKADMHPVAHTLMLGTMIVSMVETSFDETPDASMPASVFEPDRELLDARVADTIVPRPRVRSGIRPLRLTDQGAVELELDALLQLDRVGALLGEQVSVIREFEGVAIEARAETVARRDELRTALAPLAERPGARVDVRTFADAEADSRPGTPASVKVVEFPGTHGPVYGDLRTFFLTQAAASASGTNDIEEQIQRLTRTVLERSLRARLHARAIVQLTSRVSQTDLQVLDARRASEWRTAVREQARAFEQETEALRVDLEPVFYASTTSDVAVTTPTPPANVWEGAQRLLALAAANDADLGQAFARSVQAPDGPLAVRSPRFRESLVAAEALAASMRAAASSPR